MGKNSEIGWTHHTFNPWRGCSKVSPGCANCYAASQSQRNPQMLGIWGDNGTRVVASDSMWNQPLKWDQAAAAAGERHRVFAASMADVFEDVDESMVNVTDHRGEPPLYGDVQEWTIPDLRRRLFQLIDQTPNLDWLLVTKRPENIRRMWPTKEWNQLSGHETGSLYRQNVWLLTSIENQECADLRIPELLKCRELAPVLGLSCEPMLEPIDLTENENYINPECWGNCDCDSVYGFDSGCRRHGGDGHLTRHVDWVIIGGESDRRNKQRVMPLEAAIALADQCRDAGVPVYVKQDSAREDGQQVRWPDEYWALKQFPKLQLP